jgi:superfamily II DNA/RNA helicase
MLDENYRDQIEEIVKFSPKGRQTMLFSATMTDEVNYPSSCVHMQWNLNLQSKVERICSALV